MSIQRLGVIMNGVTGRMGTNQHLVRSLLAIREQGGCRLSDGTLVMPDPILVGRNPAKTEQLAKRHGVERWTCDLDRALDSPRPRGCAPYRFTLVEGAKGVQLVECALQS